MRYCHSIPFILLSFNMTVAMAAEHWQDVTYIAQSFKQVALQNEYDDQAHPLRRWEVPIRVQLIYHAPKQPLYAELTKMHLTHLSQITGHPIELTIDAKRANLRIVFTLEKRWKQDIETYLDKGALAVADGSVCMANFHLGHHGQIESANVIIPVDQAQRHRKLVTCIVEEVTQIMGLPNDAESVYPSIFNDKTPNDLLTGLDGLLLKLLYHPQLKSGMRERQLNPIVRRTLQQWKADGTIDGANAYIQNGALYPLLGY